MADVIFMDLGFPVTLVDPPMIEVWGQMVPDIDMGWIQDSAVRLLLVKAARLTGSQVGFIRSYFRLRQVDLARVLNMANHSVVSQWESRHDEPSGMDYNTEVLLRLWMATRLGRQDSLAELLETGLKNMSQRADGPLRIEFGRAP
ncbi:MAG TPA: hypothetical protein PLB35_09365 [Myxococcota bacterium]|jgi:DNA-binding transcriptional regulator YiaG|nr:hypothetical protein [Myxococcota bacterium]HOA14095.1 hypothetical protein [Myxococcota bacterium]HOH77451.1 hypothetical protein [Myxococcota bacterium]HPV05001.1 hypothetical protein [Myxococcota bacterium]